MSDIEKLRALLAEARESVEHDAEACARLMPSGTADHLWNLLGRIDAALAEPVVDWRKAHGDAIAELSKATDERDEARAELDFIKAEYGGADDDSLTRDALLLKLRLLASEMDGERASRRVYERAHDDILEALKRAAADAYHPEDGEPVALWGVERLARDRDEARAEVERLRKAVHTRACRNQSAYNLECVCGADEHQRDLQKLAYQRGAEAMREAAARHYYLTYGDTCPVPEQIRDLPVPEDKK